MTRNKRVGLALLCAWMLAHAACAFAAAFEEPVPSAAQSPVVYLLDGRYFDMSAEELIAHEAACGIALEGGGYRVEGKVSLYTYDDVKLIGYCDYDYVPGTPSGTLREVVYYFPATETSFHIIENHLLNEFGQTVYNSTTKETYQAVVKEPCVGNAKMPTSNLEYMPLFSQRLFQLTDGKFILIDHFYTNANDHKLIFFRLTPEQAAYVAMNRTCNVIIDEEAAQP